MGKEKETIKSKTKVKIITWSKEKCWEKEKVHNLLLIKRNIGHKSTSLFKVLVCNSWRTQGRIWDLILPLR